MKRRHGIAVLIGVALAGLMGGVLPAAADHAGETVALSQADGLSDGQTITVTIAGFDPAGKPGKIVTAGQGKLTTIPDKLNFDEYAVAPEITIQPDGTGTGQYIATADHGVVEDGSTLNCLATQCWIVVVQEPFLPQPNYASQPITFEGGSIAPSTPDTTAPPATEAPATTEAPTTTVAETTTTTTTTKVTVVAVSDEDDGGSGLTFLIIAGVVLVAAGAAYAATRRKAPADEDGGSIPPAGGMPPEPGAAPPAPGGPPAPPADSGPPPPGPPAQ